MIRQDCGSGLTSMNATPGAPLGSVDTCSQSLKTAVSIAINSQYPMFVWWGPHLINLYNDAYIPILGARQETYFTCGFDVVSHGTGRDGRLGLVGMKERADRRNLQSPLHGNTRHDGTRRHRQVCRARGVVAGSDATALDGRRSGPPSELTRRSALAPNREASPSCCRARRSAASAPIRR